MAKPRIFVSSTFYDLKQYRKDIEQFIRSMGYEPILNERGHIPYGKDDKLEEYCYKEIENIDVLVSIIGGRFGAKSSYDEKSISNHELDYARKLNKQVYIFIEKSVYTEYHTYLENKNNESIKYNFVDDLRIFKYIDEIKNQPINNNISQFENTEDIINYLKEQFAGLFQHLLNINSGSKSHLMVEQLLKSTETLKGLIDIFTNNNQTDKKEIDQILFKNHQAYIRLKQLMGLKFPIVFNNAAELRFLMKSLGYNTLGIAVRSKNADCFGFILYHPDGYYNKIYVKKNIFNDNGDLKLFSQQDWDDGFIYGSAEDI